MTSTVIVKRHDGSEHQYTAAGFGATDSVYVIDDTAGITWFERKCDVKELTIEADA